VQSSPIWQKAQASPPLPQDVSVLPLSQNPLLVQQPAQGPQSEVEVHCPLVQAPLQVLQASPPLPHALADCAAPPMQLPALQQPSQFAGPHVTTHLLETQTKPAPHPPGHASSGASSRGKTHPLARAAPATARRTLAKDAA